MFRPTPHLAHLTYFAAYCRLARPYPRAAVIAALAAALTKPREAARV
jgi:hypothetical protein